MFAKQSQQFYGYVAYMLVIFSVLQGKAEYFVKWKGWSTKLVFVF